MKRNIFVKLLSAFAAGLLMCGIGAGICVIEFSSLKIVEASDNLTFSDKNYTLPEGEPLYIDDWSFECRKESHDTVPKGTIIFHVEHSTDTTINFYETEDMTLCRDTYGERIKTSLVKAVLCPVFFTDPNDFDDFKNVFEHLKNKEIYVHNSKSPVATIMFNPADKDNIVFLSSYRGDSVWLEPSYADYSDAYDDEETDTEFYDEEESDVGAEYNGPGEEYDIAPEEELPESSTSIPAMTEENRVN